MFWNKYPYTDFHEMNLDWLLKKMHEVSLIVERLFPADLSFETAEEMMNSKMLAEGKVVQTLGFHSLNDGGAGLYIITKNGANNFDKLSCGNRFTAELITDKSTVNILALGAKVDTDIAEVLQFAIDKYNTIIIPEGHYYLSSVTITGANKYIFGAGWRNTFIEPVSNHDINPLFILSNVPNQLRYISIAGMSIDNINYASQLNDFDAIQIVSTVPNTEHPVSDLFFKDLVIRYFDDGLAVNTAYSGNPTDYFVQYVRMEECQISYCNHNLSIQNTYYFELLNCYLQFAKTDNIYLYDQSNYFKMDNTTLNIRQADSPEANIKIDSSRFATINNSQLQAFTGVPHIIVEDNVVNMLVSGNQFIQGDYAVLTDGTGAQINVNNNMMYSVTHPFKNTVSNYITSANNYSNTYAEWDSDSLMNFQTGALTEKISASYSGQLPAVGSPGDLTLSGQNQLLLVDSNVIKTGAHIKGCLLMQFDVTAPGTVYVYVYSGSTVIGTYRFSNTERTSETIMQFINNNDNISIKVASDNTSARFNGGTITYINASKMN